MYKNSIRVYCRLKPNFNEIPQPCFNVSTVRNHNLFFIFLNTRKNVSETMLEVMFIQLCLYLYRYCPQNITKL